MKMKLALLVAIVGLGLSILCPTLCAANEITRANTTQHKCCPATKSHQPELTCTDTCYIESEGIKFVHVHIPFIVPVFPISQIEWPSFIPTFKLTTSPHVYIASHGPPGHLVFLNTIRMQC